MHTLSYKSTRIACYMGYVTQAISINLMPLLYVTMQTQFGITLAQLGLMTTVIFVTQILIDLLLARFSRFVSYRAGCVAAHIFAAVGLIGLCIFPSLFPIPYVGVLVASVLLSVGGGLIEVLISPLIDALPSEEKTGDMSLLHSFYCWGVVAVALLSTVFFAIFGITPWRWLVILWAMIPFLTTIFFCVVPMPEKPETQDNATTGAQGSLFRFGLIWLLLALMLFAGATELGPAQWASFFAEKGLSVHKTVGDLVGPCAFAFFQGVSRIWFARLTRRWDAERLLILFGLLCVISYVVIVLSPWPFVSLLGFCLCGLAVGPMWPGILSLASRRYPAGGTRMFALAALFGDLGAAMAPALIGGVSDAMQSAGLPLASALKSSIGIAALFPLFLFICLLLLGRSKPIDEKG